MIKVETYTVANLGRARIGERFEFKGQTYEVLDIEVYENAGGQERMAVTLQTYCHVCGASFEFTVNRRPKWLKKSCGRNHAQTPWTRRRRRINGNARQAQHGPEPPRPVLPVTGHLIE